MCLRTLAASGNRGRDGCACGRTCWQRKHAHSDAPVRVARRAARSALFMASVVSGGDGVVAFGEEDGGCRPTQMWIRGELTDRDRWWGATHPLTVRCVLATWSLGQSLQLPTP